MKKAQYACELKLLGDDKERVRH